MYSDLRSAFRASLRNPAFALLAIATLGLGIGASTAVFSAVNGVLLQPLRFPQPERIVSLDTKVGSKPAFPKVTGGDLVDLRAGNAVFEALGSYAGGDIGVQVNGRAEFTGIWMVTPEFFTALGKAVPSLGNSGAVVGEGFANRHFGDARHAIGKTVEVENRIYRIAAVMSRARFPEGAEVWLPAPVIPENLNRTAYNYRAIARLRAGVTLKQAQADLDTIAGRLSAAYPKSNRSKVFLAVPLREQLTGSVRTTLYVLFGAVLLVLLIACANVSNLLLARATVRAREIAVRAALGASRARLVLMLILESISLGVAGGIAGIVLALAGTRALVSFAPPNLPRADGIGIDYAVLAFAIGLSILSAVVFGVLPALHASRAEFSSRGVLAGGSHILRNSLVIAEISLSFVLATGAGLFFRSFLALNAVDMGFRPDHMLVMNAHAPAKELGQHVDVGRSFVDRLLPSILRIPGVTAAAAVMGLPTGKYGSNGSYAVMGKHVFGEGRKMPESIWALTSPAYFGAMGIPLVRGRDFTARDDYGAPGVIIVSQSVVRDVFGGEDPIGHQIVCGLDRTSMKPMTIVGIVGDVRQNSPGAQPEPTLYMPFEQHPFYANELHVVVRTSGDPAALTGAVRKTAQELNPVMAVRFTTLEDMVSDSIAAPRFRTFLSSVFAGLALLLAAAGIYGVMNYIVTQRTSELGLRMALGARRGNVIGLVLARAALLALAGLAIGAGLSVAVSQWTAAMLFELKPTDPATYAGVVLAVGGATLLAALIPAWRAAQIDPMAALRREYPR